jgi:retron-type reverse transcriptase
VSDFLFIVKPKYHGKPIGSETALAATLGVSISVLRHFAETASDKYSTFTIPKKDGKLRSICSPSHDLKIIQKRINRSIFGNVEYPDYLYGGIAEQDYVKNAKRHIDAKALITLDVRNFYPNIKNKAVESIFQHFCKFPPIVAKLLTNLTTLNGCVPQGACTSSNIANLVLFDIEHRVVSDFKDKKLTYSRLLDDICISSNKLMKKEQTTAIIEKISSLLNARGFKIRGDKTRVTSISNPEELMEITGLWLNRGHPRAKPLDRKNIRAEMHRCEVNFSISRTSPTYHQEHDSISGRVAKLTYLAHHEAASYRDKLRGMLPHYGEKESKRIQILVGILERTMKPDRGKYSYIERFHQLAHKINILSRSDKPLADKLRSRMYLCLPTTTSNSLIYGNEF